MAAKKKPSAKPRQTKSVKPPVKAVKKPISNGTLYVIWALMAAVMVALVIVPLLPNDFSFSFMREKQFTPIPSPQEQQVITQPQKPVAEEEKEKENKEKEKLEALKEKLAKVEEKTRQLESALEDKQKALQHEMTLRGQSLIAQYARLIEHALEKGLPFPWELEQLQHAMGDRIPEADKVLQELTPYAQGVPSPEKLRQDFKNMEEEVYNRTRKEGKSTGFLASVSQMMHKVISVRRVGLLDGDTPEAIVARAEYYLDKDQMAQAVAELSAFKGSYADIVEPWIKQAKLRLEAVQLARELRELAQKSVIN